MDKKLYNEDLVNRFNEMFDDEADGAIMGSTKDGMLSGKHLIPLLAEQISSIVKGIINKSGKQSEITIDIEEYGLQSFYNVGHGEGKRLFNNALGEKFSGLGYKGYYDNNFSKVTFIFADEGEDFIPDNEVDNGIQSYGDY